MEDLRTTWLIPSQTLSTDIVRDGPYRRMAESFASEITDSAGPSHMLALSRPPGPAH